jgi:alpha-beta hydrolase superfamily lysophospholipase
VSTATATPPTVHTQVEFAADTLPPLSRWYPDGEPIGCVQIVHGMAEHRQRYARFASHLASAGYLVWAHDHRGHGLNAGSGKGHFADRNGWRVLIDDTVAVTRRLVAEHPRAPVILFGHSMGSFIAQTLITERAPDYQGIVLVGSNGPDPGPHCLALALALFERLLRGPRQQSQWTNALLRKRYNRKFRPSRTPVDWLSRDEREVDAAMADPLNGVGLTTQSWVDFAKGLLALDAPGRFRHVRASLPLLIIAGTDDPVGNNGRGPQRLVRAFTRGGAQDVSLHLYLSARHELVNETNREEITRDIVAWMDARTRRRD